MPSSQVARSDRPERLIKQASSRPLGGHLLVGLLWLQVATPAPRLHEHHSRPSYRWLFLAAAQEAVLGVARFIAQQASPARRNHLMAYQRPNGPIEVVGFHLVAGKKMSAGYRVTESLHQGRL